MCPPRHSERYGGEVQTISESSSIVAYWDIIEFKLYSFPAGILKLRATCGGGCGGGGGGGGGGSHCRRRRGRGGILI